MKLIPFPSFTLIVSLAAFSLFQESQASQDDNKEQEVQLQKPQSQKEGWILFDQRMNFTINDVSYDWDRLMKTHQLMKDNIDANLDKKVIQKKKKIITSNTSNSKDSKSTTITEEKTPKETGVNLACLTLELVSEKDFFPLPLKKVFLSGYDTMTETNDLQNGHGLKIDSKILYQSLSNLYVRNSNILSRDVIGGLEEVQIDNKQQNKKPVYTGVTGKLQETNPQNDARNFNLAFAHSEQFIISNLTSQICETILGQKNLPEKLDAMILHLHSYLDMCEMCSPTLAIKLEEINDQFKKEGTLLSNALQEKNIKLNDNFKFLSFVSSQNKYSRANSNKALVAEDFRSNIFQPLLNAKKNTSPINLLKFPYYTQLYLWLS